MEQEPGKPSFFAESKQTIEDYVQDRLLLLKLQAAEKVARLAALLFTGIVLALLSFFVLLFISMMAGYYFAGITGSLYIGFGIVATFYVVLLGLAIKFRKPVLEEKVANIIVNIFFEEEEDAA
ncbi:hypothetical protein [Parasediminibacterium sp. JCM 36343]|uniref:hypothetical protein n=1 Tax=Parasediminibacterium sp. JCM 36343 TaxID=3374279 RepID=UPI00397C98FD